MRIGDIVLCPKGIQWTLVSFSNVQGEKIWTCRFKNLERNFKESNLKFLKSAPESMYLCVLKDR